MRSRSSPITPSPKPRSHASPNSASPRSKTASAPTSEPADATTSSPNSRASCGNTPSANNWPRTSWWRFTQSGRQAEALRTFTTYGTYLADEVGLDPSDEITRLEQQILLDDPRAAISEPPRRATGPVTGLSVRGYGSAS